MKKFYAFAAAAIATLSMNAQLYVCGAGEGLAWDPSAPMTVELTDGAYKFTVKGFSEMKMSTAMGSWDDFNAGALYADLTAENVGTAVELEINGGANIIAPWPGDWTFVVTSDYKTVTATTTTAKPEGPVEIYVRGDMNGWLDGTPTEEVMNAWKFTNVEGSTYTLTCTIEMGTGFKVGGLPWGNINYGPGDEVRLTDGEYEDLWNYNADNATMGEDFTGTITITLPEVPRDPLYIVFEEDGASVGNVAVDNAPAEYFNLQGVRVAQPEAGLYIVRQGGKVSKKLVK